MKRLLFGYVFLACFTGQTQNLFDLEFGTDSTFDIVSWNIEWFPKNGTITVDSVSKIVESLQADIIACQEIDDTVAFNSMLNNLPDYAGVYDDQNFEGLAYIYNVNTIQINDSYSIYANNSFWRPFPRAPLLLKIQFLNTEFVIINNHLKCCGNGILDPVDIDDEENRRLEASTLLDEYIFTSFSTSKVIILGDLNDELTDPTIHNAFTPFLNHPSDYHFVDYDIATSASNNWSYPSWPSHLDHILITNEIFPQFNHPFSSVETIKIDHFLPNGFSDYDNDISDHRPVGLKLYVDYSVLPILADNVIADVSVYPNPATDQLYISMNDLTSAKSFTIRNSVGQIILVQEYENSQNIIKVDLALLEPGVYFCTISDTSKKTTTKKIIIE
ncbi:MAG: T9SS type A sorting domain-containing protein [Putridiphycobacter sp.]|nr:T9SS type A sorting domain-containing protein [Putridiphycobacter sp.]